MFDLCFLNASSSQGRLGHLLIEPLLRGWLDLMILELFSNL